jgi:4'-phosphopantetheinyl transferase
LFNCAWGPSPSDVYVATSIAGRNRLRMSNCDVDVWCAVLDPSAAWAQWLVQTLSKDELLRAERFHFERDRLRFIVSRGLLRVILGRYLDMEPGQLHFSYGPRGKPTLIETPTDGKGKLCFNLAHSNGLALIGVTREREIGVDFEYIRPIANAEQIVQSFFSPREIAMLQSVPRDQKLTAFFNCWTRKEAYVKATGDGLAQPLNQFSVSLAPCEPAKLLAVAADAREVSRWCIQSLTPAPGYVAAVVVEGHAWLCP